MTALPLKNGLRVVLHEDHCQPLDAGRVLYEVGHRYDPPGQQGMTAPARAQPLRHDESSRDPRPVGTRAHSRHLVERLDRRRRHAAVRVGSRHQRPRCDSTRGRADGSCALRLRQGRGRIASSLGCVPSVATSWSRAPRCRRHCARSASSHAIDPMLWGAAPASERVLELDRLDEQRLSVLAHHPSS